MLLICLFSRIQVIVSGFSVNAVNNDMEYGKTCFEGSLFFSFSDAPFLQSLYV
jgi:hypothetical protein